MDIYEVILNKKKNGKALIIATVVDKVGNAPVAVGTKMLIGEDGECHGTIGGGMLELRVEQKALELLKLGANLTERYLLDENKVIDDLQILEMACGGEVEVFYEYVGPKGYIYLFGAGHIGQALSKLLKNIGFYVTVIDDRVELLEMNTKADRQVRSPYLKFIDEEGIRNGSFVVVCTPSHQYDYDIVDRIFEMTETQPKYMGMLCSKKKLRSYLGKAYQKYGEDLDLSNFYSPIGLRTGGSSPDEIAISIVAEIMSVANDKQGHLHMRGSEYPKMKELNLKNNEVSC